MLLFLSLHTYCLSHLYWSFCVLDEMKYYFYWLHSPTFRFRMETTIWNLPMYDTCFVRNLIWYVPNIKQSFACLQIWDNFACCSTSRSASKKPAKTHTNLHAEELNSKKNSKNPWFSFRRIKIIFIVTVWQSIHAESEINFNVS